MFNMRAISYLCVLATCLLYVSALPKPQQRVVGGSSATIAQYPSVASLLHSQDLITYRQQCVGSILNVRSILTVAHCVENESEARWRVRVGSASANAGGTVHAVAAFHIHPDYNHWTHDSDLAIMRTATAITYIANAVKDATIAGPNYIPDDEQPVWAAGWGATEYGGQNSEQLRHVQLWTVNQRVCRTLYRSISWEVTDSMLCAGYLDVGGRDLCEGDDGAAVYHNGNIVGVYAWGYRCGLPDYPAVTTRVSAFTPWIQANV